MQRTALRAAADAERYSPSDLEVDVGAWGVGSFENDDAADWFYELEAEGLPATAGPLTEVVALEGEYLEAPTCCRALAAAEVLAAVRGRPASDLPDDVAAWSQQVAAEARPEPVGPELLLLARQAVARIAENSELRDLWEETPDFQEWAARLADLKARLA